MHQTSNRLLRERLREALRSAMDSCRDDPSSFESIQYRAAATLYMLLLSHPVDARGRCRSCRRPGVVFGRRWRRCRVHGEASLWLHQPIEVVDSLLTRELGLACAKWPGSGADVGRQQPADRAVLATDRDGTWALPQITTDPYGPSVITPQSRPSTATSRVRIFIDQAAKALPLKTSRRCHETCSAAGRRVPGRGRSPRPWRS